MKTYVVSLECGDYEICVKTRKSEKPMHCEGCGKRIKKGMYCSQADAGEWYCLECCTK